MRRIALEEHFVINQPAHVERWAGLIPNVPTPVKDKLLPVLADLGEQRLAAMAAAGIDFAVLSNVGSVQGILDPTPALQLAREANDYLASVVQRHPDHFAGFATVPLPDPEVGAAELERAVRDLGMKGALVLGQTNGQYLDHDRFQPFWERVQDLDVPIYLHAADPMVPPPSYAGRPELIGATWSWTAETATHALRLIFGGVFERYPRVKVLLGHMGETLPYLLWRFDERAQAFTEGKAIKPSEIIRRNFAVTTAGTPSNEPLGCALQAMGEENVLFSVDHPFESMEVASKWLDAAPLTAAVREQISWGNAARILKL